MQGFPCLLVKPKWTQKDTRPNLHNFQPQSITNDYKTKQNTNKLFFKKLGITGMFSYKVNITKEILPKRMIDRLHTITLANSQKYLKIISCTQTWEFTQVQVSCLKSTILSKLPQRSVLHQIFLLYIFFVNMITTNSFEVFKIQRKTLVTLTNHVTDYSGKTLCDFNYCCSIWFYHFCCLLEADRHLASKVTRRCLIPL